MTSEKHLYIPPTRRTTHYALHNTCSKQGVAPLAVLQCNTTFFWPNYYIHHSQNVWFSNSEQAEKSSICKSIECTLKVRCSNIAHSHFVPLHSLGLCFVPQGRSKKEGMSYGMSCGMCYWLHEVVSGKKVCSLAPINHYICLSRLSVVSFTTKPHFEK